MTSLPTFQDLFDPRGRASRSGLLAVALLLLAADAVVFTAIVSNGAPLTSPGTLAFKVVSAWIATVGVIKRLHDLDLSAWWVAKALAAFVGWAIVVSALLLVKFDAADVLNLAHPAFWLNLAATAAPMLGVLLWLHFARGTPGLNRFGAEPGARGFSMPDPAVTAQWAAGRQSA